MSRIGKKPIPIPPGVTIKVTDHIVSIQGSQGEIRRTIPRDIHVEIKDEKIIVSPIRAAKKSSALWGMSRSILANMVEGAARGFSKKLELEGIGYRAALDGSTLVLQAGFSHPVRFSPPPGITLSVEKNVITVSGPDKELVGTTAARIRAVRPPEPYKGKGIRYLGEVIRRKAGKKAVAGG